MDDVQNTSSSMFAIQDVRLIGSDYSRTLLEWRRRLERGKDAVVERFGLPTFDHYMIYFDSAVRCFEGGYTDLLQLSLRVRSL